MRVELDSCWTVDPKEKSSQTNLFSLAVEPKTLKLNPNHEELRSLNVNHKGLTERFGTKQSASHFSHQDALGLFERELTTNLSPLHLKRQTWGADFLILIISVGFKQASVLETSWLLAIEAKSGL